VANTSIAQVALELGACGYVTKPFTPGQLVVAVANAIRRRTLERENADLRLHARPVPAAPDTSERRPGGLARVRRSLGDAASDALARAIEGGPMESGLHVTRVGACAGIIASALGMPPATCQEIAASAVFHDVGKLEIPNEILWKPGALTADEFELMKQHSERGRAILARSGEPALALAAAIALTHHERWDGTGYPRGLAGPAIPIEGRIVAVADVFDVLVNRSVYRSRLELGPALEVMRSERGTQFDPDVLDAFLEHAGDASRILEPS
jgi:putative two-component system response regulator